ncbi:MAG: tRNA (adenosine(37)-N6)-threonylcarbamoyltransferase complex dimerization subunit type 1 TsaB [Chlorobiales bacterium]|nr:tRNA (adenosine(37)-N6)-threonylcarbamoyltransferase complex dimerization subunit type 1 TsaB [Chlorobiales bacterium]
MKILAIECTHQVACVAVSNGNRNVERVSAEWQKTAEAIVPLVMQAMTGAGLSPADLDGVAVSAGPGSFTALRIGMSAAKGIAYGAGCPLVPVPTLLAMASAACAHTGAQCLVPLIPSRPGEYFYAVYQCEDGAGIVKELDNGRCMVAELTEKLKALDTSFTIPVRDMSLLVSYAPELAGSVLDASFFTAESLLGFAESELSKGAGAALSDASPDYRQIFVPLRKKQ